MVASRLHSYTVVPLGYSAVADGLFDSFRLLVDGSTSASFDRSKPGGLKVVAILTHREWELSSKSEQALGQSEGRRQLAPWTSLSTVE